MIRTPAILFSAALAAPAFAQATVVVDASGGGDFTTIQAAVDAAAAGDLLLVRTGVYGGFRVEKSLEIAADEGHQPIVDLDEPALESAVTIFVPGGFVSLVGLEIREEAPPSVIGEALVSVLGGSALIQDCSLHAEQAASPGPLRGVHVLGADSTATLVRTTVDMRLAAGVDDGFFFFDAGDAVLVEGGSVFLYDCELFAGFGHNGSVFGPSAKGRSGVHLRSNAFGFASGCTITGGRGGEGGHGSSSCAGGQGGSAVRLTTVDLLTGAVEPCELVLVGNVLVPGPGGSSVSPCSPAPGGVPAEVEAPSTVNRVPVAARSLDTSGGVVGDMTTWTVSLSGEPFDFVALALSTTSNTPVLVPELNGAFYPGSPFVRVSAGFLDASGAKELTFTNEDLGVPFVPVYVQAFHFGIEQEIVAANPRLVLLLDE